MAFFKTAVLSVLVYALVACSAVPDLETRRAAALSAGSGALTQILIPTRMFDIAAFVPKGFGISGGAMLTIYIEGDGLAWITRSQPSTDPTPATPLVIGLMEKDPRVPKAYLARPCQYVGASSRNCDVSLWTNARFSADVVAAVDEAISTLKAQSGALSVHLVGYSGGGVLAALAAVRRADVAGITTLAAPMDTDAFTAHHSVSPLVGSLNPKDIAAQLATVPQLHLVGEDDTVVPESILQSYLRAMPPDSPCIRTTSLPGVTHNSGWQSVLPQIHQALPLCWGAPS
ncbi:hypothetical protein [Pyruvatibacter sp.]|uniref:hypothetical protein n=1 Tax=Pyruvatibacter sp. TaxID=1981328 RepID=UPI0032ECD280